MKVTREFLLSARTPNGGWTRAQLEFFGIEWPPRSPWIRYLEGRDITEEQAKQFIELGNPKQKKLFT